MNRRLLLLLIAVCTLVSQPARAQSNLGFKRGGLAISMVSPDNVNTSLGLGVFADMGTVAPRWALEPRLDWWSHTERIFTVDAKVSDVTLGARTKYQFPVTHSTVQPFAGGGLGVHFLSVEAVAVDPFTGTAFSSKATETRLGVDLGGGISTAMNPSTQFLAEGWYSIVSDFNQFSLRVGLSHSFGN